VEEGGLIPRSAGRYGPVFAARAVIWWRSRWRRTAEAAGGHAIGAANHPYRRASDPPARGAWSGSGCPGGSAKPRPRLSLGQLWLYARAGRFWQRCGFTLVRLGTHREASSGCYTAMALYPLTSAGHELVLRESQRLARDEFWLWEWREALFPGRGASSYAYG
jgi:hypothetical protein